MCMCACIRIHLCFVSQSLVDSVSLSRFRSISLSLHVLFLYTSRHVPTYTYTGLHKPAPANTLGLCTRKQTLTHITIIMLRDQTFLYKWLVFSKPISNIFKTISTMINIKPYLYLLYKKISSKSTYDKTRNVGTCYVACEIYNFVVQLFSWHISNMYSYKVFSLVFQCFSVTPNLR